MAGLFGSADVQKATPAIALLANDAMLTAVVGQTFHGTLASAAVDQTPKREPANVTSAPLPRSTSSRSGRRRSTST